MKIDVPIVQFRFNDLAHFRSIIIDEQQMIFDMVLLGERCGQMRKPFRLNNSVYVQSRNSKLPLIKCEGLPVSPAFAEYRRDEHILFKLHFQAPQPGTQFIDLIEDESHAKNSINQYRVCVDKAAEINIMHRWVTIGSVSEMEVGRPIYPAIPNSLTF